jgi:hypothetical protein
MTSLAVLPGRLSRPNVLDVKWRLLDSGSGTADFLQRSSICFPPVDETPNAETVLKAQFQSAEFLSGASANRCARRDYRKWSIDASWSDNDLLVVSDGRAAEMNRVQTMIQNDE